MALKTTEIERAIFLTHLEYVPLPKAAKKTGINRKTATNIKLRATNLEGERLKAGLPPPTIQELIRRKEGSGANPMAQT